MNPQHVEIVDQGREAIDEWREANPEKRLDLSGANLILKDLSEANLSGADLSGADLMGATLSGADLSGANLGSANFSQTHMFRVNLYMSDMRGADLRLADLFEADLSLALLTVGDLRWSQLVKACLAKAELTGTKLYGTARDDWDIEGVKCQYVFWDEAGLERSPRDRDLEAGEFERLYAQLPTIEYVFENGITPLDPLVMDRIVQAINQRNPEFELQIDSISARGLQPTIKFTVQREEQKTAALEAVTRGYELEYAKLQGKYEELRELIYRVMDRPGSAPINIGSGSMVAIGGSSINLQEYIGHLHEIQEAIENAPPETFTQATKREAQAAVRKAISDVVGGKVKEAVEAVCRLGVETVPHIVNTGACQFFKNLVM